ncbi:diguanylate cyclase [Terasakiella sp. SH-1]|uniref:diguanylate cyclase domain-containing protein n=1 Tax=Terasakiella sp. SH-1 TaxID=2560057 RepID=UPI001073D4F2|nr:diguanylate cyclase [Terasakiella sp. SH-1]
MAPRSKKEMELSELLAWSPNTGTGKFVLNPAYWLFPLALWALIVGASLYHNVREVEQHTLETATNKGRFIFAMVEDVRLWNARHGGTYVPETEQSPSNPFLNDPSKDIITLEGRKLTKLNPAYMTRQIASVIQENSQTIINITSLKPLNPNNMADPWERNALSAFEQKNKEMFAFINMGEIDLFRYMAPLMVKKSCLTCHAHQGYQTGDVRGGISISFSANSFLKTQNAQIRTHIILHTVAFAALCALTLFGLTKMRRQMTLLATLNKRQEEIVQIRTHDLQEESRKRHEAEARFRLFIDASAEGIVALDTKGICTFANPKAAKLLDLKDAEELIGRNFHEASGHHTHCEKDIATHNCPLFECTKQGKERYSDKEFFCTSKGIPFPVEYFASPVYDDGAIIGIILTFVDISARKAHQSEITKLSTAVEQSPATTIITDRNGVIEFVNERFCEVTGYGKEEVIGRTPSLLKSGHTDKNVYQSMWATLLNGKEWKGEFLNRKKDGTLFWEEALISPISNEYNEITHFVAVKRDITEFKLEMDEVWRQANYDLLTNLPNRHLFEDRLENAVALALREDRQLALLFIDLDGFKAVNDTFGHDAGDHVLKISAQRLKGLIRHSDTAARLGGDEFVIILHEPTSPDNVAVIAQKIIDEVSTDINFKGDDMAVSASIGIAMMPHDSTDPHELLRYADIAMYGAKQDGKNGFCYYERYKEGISQG